ncbi:ABA4-like family protein [Amycolatopsis sp. OK19-0408]|uniref:ABA4-like family protein n=1 Tax=Amycolatopsis iheyensis TaxID=2945988 RepID=A0A9X2SN57_9PSEU|nr:ABA4-like family protein [Amycolatopsis iheyensis]MCR6488572.1 ABA4-like family protein [Amycolatopsis iheyensis]
MTLFSLAFPLAAPFWALMILAPKWRWTSRIMASPWVPLLPLACYFALELPHFGEWGRAMLSPDLGVLQTLLATPWGAGLVWAHLIAFDLFIARWMYFEGRERGISAWVVSPILLLTIFLSPFGLVVFLVVRAVRIRSLA